MVRVLIVSSIALYREALCALLNARDDIDVVGIAADAPEAARLLVDVEPPPDVVLFDMSFPENARAVRWLVCEQPDAHIFAISVAGERDVIACAELGVVGLVTSEASVGELVSSLECVARDELLCTPAVAAALLRRVAASARDVDRRAPLNLLTSREQEVVGLIDAGLSNKQIAYRLCIAVPTVRNHVHNILSKLGVHGRSEAAALIRGQSVYGSLSG
jgi:DNA-binding NarL/FixJ family response regulator